MKSMEVTKSSLAELFEKKEQRECEFEARLLAETEKMYVQLVRLAQLMNITLRQLMLRGVAPGDAPPKLFYVNPANISQQWHGRGAKPKWLRDWQAAGKSLDMVRM